MKKLFTFLCYSLFLTTISESQVIYQEDFETSGLPNGWSIQSNATDGGWKVGTASQLSSQYFTIRDNGTGKIVGTNDDDCNCDKSNEYLISPPIDLSGIQSAALSFDSYYSDSRYQGSQEEATIEVSLDGVNWVIIEDLHGHGSWDKHSIDLTDFVGNDSVYIGFRYHDDGGWMFGFAIDNVIVQIPPPLEVDLVEIEGKLFGEVDRAISIEGTILNDGGNTITSIEMSYSINSGIPVIELIENLTFESFTYYNFEMSEAWIPLAPGNYTIDVKINKVNGVEDIDLSNNEASFESEIFDMVVVPNRVDELLAAPPIVNVLSGAGTFLDRPTDLDFFPILGKDELWVVNQRNESDGGSTLTISDLSTSNPDFAHKVDGNSWHFMSLPTGIAFSDDNFNFATSTGVKDANHNNGTFTGPSLWSSDPLIYAQPSGGNGSHLDMLHGSPFCMGIAHEVDNVFWVYDDWNKDIVRYDFVNDHGPGNDDHSDAIVHRYQNIGIKKDGDIPNHLVLDKATGWLYFVDNGNDRVIRLDIESGTNATDIPLINEALASHQRIDGFNAEVIISSGIGQACGIEIFENRLFVGDYQNGNILVYDMDNNFDSLGIIPTGSAGLTGIKMGPDGNLWCTNRIENQLISIQPGVVTSTQTNFYESKISISPNPSRGFISIQMKDFEFQNNSTVSVRNTSGQLLMSKDNVKNQIQLDLTEYPSGIYLIELRNSDFTILKKVVIQK